MRVPYKVTVLLFLLFAGQELFGQEGSIMTNLKSNLARANELYTNFSYQGALTLYLHVIEKKPDQHEVKLKIAECYRKLNDPEKAAIWYAQVVELNTLVEPVHLLYYAQALNASGQYNEAKAWFARYLDAAKSDRRALNKIWGINNLADFYRDSAQYTLQKLDINSKAADFGPSYYKDGIVFISAVGKELFVQHIYSWDQTSPLDLYFSKIQAGGRVSAPQKFHHSINTRYHEGPAVFYNQDQNMIFTRSLYQKGKLQKSKDGVSRIGLFEASRKKNGHTWTEIKPLPFNNESHSVGHPALTGDGNRLYFVSDMPGGLGGLDLYVSQREGGSWRKPVNLGPKINTEGNEMFPFLHQDSVLYFSSDGYGGLGGLDVYKAELTGEKALRVSNLGYPINTHSDDFGLILNNAGSGGFFSSNRKGGRGSDDIYQFRSVLPQIEVILTDAADRRPLEGAEITLSDNKKQHPIPGNAHAGKVYFAVKVGDNYLLKTKKEGYSSRAVLIAARTLRPGDTLSVKVALEKIKPVSTRLVAYVYDSESGRAVSDAAIYLLDEINSEEKYEKTNEKGLFSFDANFASSYAIIAEKGEKTGLISSLIANDPAVLRNDTIRIPLYGTAPAAKEDVLQFTALEGTIVDADDNHLIKGAKVRLFDMANQQEVKATPQNGKINFKIKDEHYILKVEKENYLNKSVIISTKNLQHSGKVQVKIQLAKEKPTSTTLVAYVYDEKTKQPESNAEVFLLNESTSDSKSLLTDAKGFFRFEASFTDSYAVIVEKAGKANIMTSIVASDPSVLKNDTIQIALSSRSIENTDISKEAYPEKLLPTLAKVEEDKTWQQQTKALVVQGFAVDAYSGQLLDQAEITLVDNTTRAEIKGKQANGKFCFNGTVGRTYIVKGSQLGYARKAIVVSTKENASKDTVSVKLLMDKLKPTTVLVTAHVYDQQTGKPIDKAQVYLLDEFTIDEKRLKTDRKGNVSFQATLESSYAIIAETSSKYGIVSGFVAEQAGDTVQVSLADIPKPDANRSVPVVIRAIFVDVTSGERLSQVKAELVEGRSQKEMNGVWSNDQFIVSVKTNTNYILKSTKDGYKPGNLAVPTQDQADSDTLQVLVKLQKLPPPPIPVLAQVVDAETGKALPGTHIYLLNETTSEEKRLITDQKGSVEFTPSPKATYTIVAERGSKNRIFTNVSTGDNALVQKGVLQIALSDGYSKPLQVPALASPEVTSFRKPVENRIRRVSLDDPATESAVKTNIYSFKNSSGNNQVFIHYKDQLLELRKKEDLQNLQSLTGKTCFTGGQTDNQPSGQLLEMLRQKLANCSMEVGINEQIKSVFYGVDKSILRPAVKAELDKLVSFMKKFSQTKVELRAYTDSRETDAYNYRLSERRAKTAYEYLVSHGIAPKRIKTYAFGEKGLVNHCRNGVHCPDALHQQNRRTEFIIRY